MYVETSPRETRAFVFYLERTAPHLSSFDDCLFWEQLVPQIAFTDYGVRHGLIALASCHENFQNRDLDKVENARFTLRQYNAAIEKCVSWKECSNPRFARGQSLLSCLIFICIEIMRGHYVSASVLLRQGLKIISDQSAFDGASSIPGPYRRIFEVSKSLLLRLEIQAIALVGNEAWEPEHSLHNSNDQLKIPDAFSSVTEARDSLNDNRLTFNLYALGRKTGHNPSRYSTVLQRWSTALDAFLANHEDNLTDQHRRAVIALKMQRLLLYGFVNVGVNRSDVEDQTLWDKNNSIFEDVVSLAESTLSNAPSACTPLFTLDIGFVASLYDVARRCRDPQIRRRAISLLRSSARQEGFWNGQLAARAAERVVELEEGHILGNVTASSDIPGWARITAVIPVFDREERVVRARFSRVVQARQSSIHEIIAF